jgi:hypothetical protein
MGPGSIGASSAAKSPAESNKQGAVCVKYWFDFVANIYVLVDVTLEVFIKQNYELVNIEPQAPPALDKEQQLLQDFNNPLDKRTEPEYEVVYKQAVTSEDMFIQMGNKTPLTSSCESMLVRLLYQIFKIIIVSYTKCVLTFGFYDR